MKTEVLQVDPIHPQSESIKRASTVLQEGRLVAFPTETVYGLGADALDRAAVKRIFEAKGRPIVNPVIVHVASADAVRAVVSSWPDTAQRLAGRFWPGPLTLVLPKRDCVPGEVTAGGPTVGVRVPKNTIALALLEESGCPIAAPSANRSSRISPTRAEHVLRSLGGRIDLILDGGPTQVGIESTVLDLTADLPRLLRPGAITAEEIEAVIGPIEIRPRNETSDVLRSPGMQERHYAPNTSVVLVSGNGAETVERMVAAGLRAGWLQLPISVSHYEPAPSGVVNLEMPANPREYAARLYSTLHEMDEKGLDRIVVDMPPNAPEWSAVMDRLVRAAAGGEGE